MFTQQARAGFYLNRFIAYNLKIIQLQYNNFFQSCSVVCVKLILDCNFTSFIYSYFVTGWCSESSSTVHATEYRTCIHAPITMHSATTYTTPFYFLSTNS